MERKPYFLIRGMSPALRAQLELDAQDDRLPIQEVVRAILCAHYELECSPIEGMIRKDAWGDALTIRVTMQPELHFAIQEDSAQTGESMQALTHAALEAHYLAKGERGLRPTPAAWPMTIAEVASLLASPERGETTHSSDS